MNRQSSPFRRLSGVGASPVLLACVSVAALVLLAWTPQDPNALNPSSRVNSIRTSISKSRLQTQVETLAAFYTRDFYSTTTIPQAAAWIYNEFDAIRQSYAGQATVAYHDFVYNDMPGKNVYLWVRGSRYPNRVIVYGAHYDSINSTNSVPSDRAPGANDNASGTSAVIEMARAFAPTVPEVGVMFVAFSGEEYGLRGARAFAPYLEGQGLEILAMVNTDIIGDVDDANGNVARDTCRCYSAGPSDSMHRILARYIKTLGELYLSNFTILVQSTTDRVGRSGDHKAFSDRGHTAARLIATYENLNRQHNANDLPEYMDWDYLETMANLVAAVVGNLALGPRTPTGLQNNTDGSLSWNAVAGASKYVLFIRTDGVNDQVRTVIASGTSASPAGLVVGDHVAVAAVSSSEEVGLPSAEITVASVGGGGGGSTPPASPTPVSPVNVLLGSNPVNFECTDVGGDGYEFRILTNSNGSWTDYATLSSSTFTASTSLPTDGIYRWQVRAQSGGAWSAWSETAEFELTSGPTAPPGGPATNLQASVDGGGLATLTWDPASGTTSYEVTLQRSVLVRKKKSWFKRLIAKVFGGDTHTTDQAWVGEAFQTVGGSPFQFQLSQPGTYRFQIVPRNGLGTGPFSGWVQFAWTP